MIHNALGASSALDEYAAEWRRLPRATPAERQAAAAYYEAHVLPLLRLEFAAREHPRLPRRYTGLIVAVGGEATPAILAVDVIRPLCLHWAYGSEGEPALERALAALGRSASPYERTRLDEPEILTAYAAVRDVLGAWDAPAAVDITGATPAAAAGMAMAAYAAGAGLLAVEAGEFWADVCAPRPGSEHLSLPPQPFAAFGDLAEAEARAAWARHDFGLAHKRYAWLAELDAARYRPCRDLAAAYAAWQVGDATEALAAIDAALEALGQTEAHPLAGQRPELLAQAAALARLAALTAAREEPPDLQVLAQGDVVAALAFTLRREAALEAQAGRHGLAVLLLYRLLELIMQRRLARHGLSTAAPDYATLAMPDLAATLAARRLALLGEAEAPELPRTIGLGAGLVILSILDDPVAAAIDWPRLRRCLPLRSRSLLIHGFRHLGRDDSRDFSQLVEPVMQSYCEAEGLACAQMEEVYRFVEV
ncbi:MAG TPA: TIGR02710 family CRISPR-associated CARF protein [Anaerolineae bacterium]|nr:TIGR02710 family CRISPR-associated CARF protein [Anaerolineae bacterium]HOQ98465.1 TIGR02710 family CRISPR-associated CARF protein [Anaerolineae bacterium]HPL30222.1 TIGR02710 family CRISPR-associated CARF protein [Anaerolineae bacterium]